eukprot:321519-Rhodomonas_salina.2
MKTLASDSRGYDSAGLRAEWTSKAGSDAAANQGSSDRPGNLGYRHNFTRNNDRPGRYRYPGPHSFTLRHR